MGNYLGDIWRCRYFWLSLVRMDLRTRYRRSVLGVGWSLLHPLAMTAILCFVFHRIFKTDIADYGPYLLSGLACWQYLLQSTVQGCQCFFQGQAYIRQCPVPLAVYPLRTVLGCTIHFLIALGITILLTGLLRGFAEPLALISLAPSLALMFVLVWSLATVAGFATVLFQDTQHLAEVAFQILFYATPIIYTPAILKEHQLDWLMRVNPVVPLLCLFRDPIWLGRFPEPATYAAAAATVLATASLACLVLHLLQRRLIYYL